MRITNIGRLFLFGLLIKLLLMPWAMHSDLLSMYFRAHLMAEHGIWGLGINQYLGHFLYAVNLLALKALGWNLESFFLHDYGLYAGSLTASVGDWLRLMEHQQINSFLFWLKLPHLLVDIGIFVALKKLFRNHSHKTVLLASWWLNPVNIYAFYIFSRHDVFTAAALLAVIIFIARNKVVSGLVSLFVAIQIRVQPLLLAPLFVVQLWHQRHNYQQLLRQSLAAGLIICSYLLVLTYLPKTGSVIDSLDKTASPPAAIGIPTRHASQVFGTTLFGLPVFLSIYAVVGLWWLFQKRLNKASHQTRLTSLIKVSTAVMALYFAINPFSPHYFVWLSILLTLAVSISPKVLRWYGLAVLGWLGLGIFGSDLTWFSQNLFAPISTVVFRTPQFNQFLLPRLAEVGLSQTILLNIGRGVLATGLLGIIWVLYQQQIIAMVKKRFPKQVLVGLFLAILFSSPKSVQALAVPVYDQPSATEQHDITKTPFQQQITIPTEVQQFGTIEVRMGTDRSRNPGAFTFKLSAVLDSGELDGIYEAEYQRTNLYQGYYYPFGFWPIDTTALGKTFLIELSSQSDAPIYVYTDDTGQLSYTILTNTSAATFANLLFTQLKEKLQQQQLFFIGYSMLIGSLFFVLLGSCLQAVIRKSK